jgi:hypothetical protein
VSEAKLDDHIILVAQYFDNLTSDPSAAEKDKPGQ